MRRICLFAVCMLVVAGLLCTSGVSASAAEKLLRVNLATEPRTIDPTLNSEAVGSRVIMNCFEGLMGYDTKFMLKPEVAESYTLSDNGLVYTFKLRKESIWSNGEPVTAKDFDFAWKRVLDPALATDYATELFCIKNAKEYNAGKVDVSEVGIRVVDDLTLEVTLENPTPFFLDLLTMYYYFPVNAKIVSANKEWTLNPETYVGNGAFKLLEWRPKDTFVMVKNEKYRGAANVKLDRIELRILTDANSTLATFEAGDLDVIDGNLPAAMVPQLVAEGKVVTDPYFGTVWINVNVSDNAMTYNAEQSKALLDPRVRKALNLAINRKTLVKHVAKTNQEPATSLVPYGILDDKGKEFKTKDYFKAEGDIAEAKRLLAEAGYPDGKGFPELTYVYSGFGENADVSQAVQAMWKTNLNITVNLEDLEYGVLLDRRKANNRQYTLAWRRWIGDYPDPVTFLELFTYASGKNYNNPKFEELMEQARKTVNQEKRFAILREVEDVLMEDMPFILLYYMTNPLMIREGVVGFKKSPLGNIYYKNVDIQK